MYLTASEHNEPLKIFGKQGQGKDEFYQPTAIAIDENEMIYIVDTGNSRIKVRVQFFNDLCTCNCFIKKSYFLGPESKLGVPKTHYQQRPRGAQLHWNSHIKARFNRCQLEDKKRY